MVVRLIDWCRKRWFLVGLGVLIPLGLVAGSQTASRELLEAPLQHVSSRWVTALVLFLMSVTLPMRQLQAALRRPTPVLWACCVNYGLIPSLAILLLPFQSADFRVGLMIAASVPCTMAAASVWTRRAGGNDAVSLLVTVGTNGSCFLITPLWLNWRTGQSFDLEIGAMMVRLLTAVLVPMAVAQLLRGKRQVAAAADQYKPQLGVIAQALILVLVFLAAFTAGGRMSRGDHPELSDVGIVWASCIALHVIALMVAYRGGLLMKFSSEDARAVAFAGSQKTLPIGVLLADMVSHAHPFAVFPMLMFHASQLFVDTAVADRLREAHRQTPVNGADDSDR